MDCYFIPIPCVCSATVDRMTPVKMAKEASRMDKIRAKTKREKKKRMKRSLRRRYYRQDQWYYRQAAVLPLEVPPKTTLCCFVWQLQRYRSGTTALQRYYRWSRRYYRRGAAPPLQLPPNMALCCFDRLLQRYQAVLPPGSAVPPP